MRPRAHDGLEDSDSGGGLVETVCPQAHDALWRSVIDVIKREPGNLLLAALLGRVRLLGEGGPTLRLGVADPFALDLIQRRHLCVLRGTASTLAGEPIDVELSLVRGPGGEAGAVGAAGVPGAGSEDALGAGGARAGDTPVGAERLGEGPEDGGRGGAAAGSRGAHAEAPGAGMMAGAAASRQLHEVVVGPSNQEANAAGLRVLAAPGALFNPLYLHGPPGSGKTHHLRALFRAFRLRSSQRGGPGAGPANFEADAPGQPPGGRSRRVALLDAERFFRLYAISSHNGSLTAFQERLRTLDVLLLDDVHKLVNKEKTQVELLHTLQALVDGGRQVVVTGDVPPGALKGIDASLVGRLAGGLSVGLHRADAATRLGVAALTAKRLRADLAPGVLELLATRVRGGAREVQGAINRLHLHQQAHGKVLGLEEARGFLDAVLHDLRRGVTLARVLECVCRYYEAPCQTILAQGRDRGVARARRVAMYLCDKYTEESMTVIGRFFGNRRHSSIRHAIDAVERSLAERDLLLAREIEGVEALLEE